MKASLKLVLDIVMGAVIPILILNYLTTRLGAVNAYLLAALVPVSWVFIDLFFITRRFNVITSYVGLSAIVRGMLAFWLVDGWLFAIKDSAGFIVAIIVFGATVVLNRPMMRAFLLQGLNPDTPAKAQGLTNLFHIPEVNRALMLGTIIVLINHTLSGGANFILNLVMVRSPFGTEAFNFEVASVNAITRIALTIPEMVSFSIAFWLFYRASFKHLPSEAGKHQLESDFWDLVAMREGAE